MAVYTTRWFGRWARKQGLIGSALCAAVDEMTAGKIEADLGGGLLKKRVARPGMGKSAGFRTLVASNRTDRWIFVFGFSKSERGNINKGEERALKKLSAQLVSFTAAELQAARRAEVLTEVECDAQEQVSDP